MRLKALSLWLSFPVALGQNGMSAVAVDGHTIADRQKHATPQGSSIPEPLPATHARSFWLNMRVVECWRCTSCVLTAEREDLNVCQH